MVEIQILNKPLDISFCSQWVMTPETGGINMFVGTVRNETNGRRVLRLEFEAYESMAVKEMKDIAAAMSQQWHLQRILIHHRKGILMVGDIPVIIAVAAAHREAAFLACKYAIDTLKKTVPIWKKEVFEDGSHWVAAHP